MSDSGEDILSINVVEAYRGYRPPIDAKGIVLRILGGLPQKYLAGLHDVILTNASGMNHDRRRRKIRRRGRKVHVKRARGMYHEEYRGEPAWIELFVDNIVDSVGVRQITLPLMAEYFMCKTLCHEIGHHIHATSAPEHREKEDVADMWSRRLLRHYFRRRRRLAILLMRVAFWTVRAVVWLVKRLCGSRRRRQIEAIEADAKRRSQ